MYPSVARGFRASGRFKRTRGRAADGLYKSSKNVRQDRVTALFPTDLCSQMITKNYPKKTLNHEKVKNL